MGTSSKCLYLKVFRLLVYAVSQERRLYRGHFYKCASNILCTLFWNISLKQCQPFKLNIKFSLKWINVLFLQYEAKVSVVFLCMQWLDCFEIQVFIIFQNWHWPVPQLPFYHPLRVKGDVIRLLCNRATIICQGKQDLAEEMDNIKEALLLSDYSLHCSQLISQHSMEFCRIQSFKESGKFTCICIFTLCIGCVRSLNVSGADIFRTIFKTIHSIRSSLMRAKPQADPWQIAHCVYSMYVGVAEIMLGNLVGH